MLIVLVVKALEDLSVDTLPQYTEHLVAISNVILCDL